MKLDRRDALRFAAGGAVGAVLTPLPWKLLDDTSIWTQNWSWIPPVPRGPVSYKNSTCTLCPGACGVRAKCVGGRAVGLEGLSGHPVSRGALCPAGFGGHAAAYHQRRLREARRGDLANVKTALERGKFAILDLGPMRAASALFAQAAASRDGLYLRIPDRDEAFLDRIAAMTGRERGSLGVDLEHARTLISFGAPVLEDWGTPGRVQERRRSGELKVIQIDPRQSRTALAADKWYPSEPAIEELLGVEQPAVAVGDPDRAVALNVALGAIGREGGIVSRDAEPWGRTAWIDLASAPVGSISLLLIDASRAYDVVPWASIQPKLAPNALVVACAYKEDALTKHADWVLPVAAPFETIEDAGTPPCAALSSYAVSNPLIEPPLIAQTPIDHVNELLGTSLPSIADTIKERLAKVGTPESGVWVGEPSKDKVAVKSAVEPAKPVAKEDGLVLFATSVRAHDSNPLLTKLYQESGLYTPFSLARIHPETGRTLGMRTNDRATIENAGGSVTRTVLLDPAVMPGAIEVALSAEIDDIGNVCCGGTAVNVRRS